MYVEGQMSRCKYLLEIYLLWSHYFWFAELSASNNRTDSINAFWKLLEKNGTLKSSVTSKSQTSGFSEVLMTSTIPPTAAKATPLLPITSDGITEILETVLMISSQKEEPPTESVILPELRNTSKPENVSQFEDFKNESIALEEQIPTHVNETVNATLPSTEAEQANGESEVMPSFDEWKRRKLAEQIVKDDRMAQPANIPIKKVTGQKRRRNYASYECGAKVVAANSEAESTSRILNEQMDEYMLNPCHAKIWFVIELCETIQVAQIEIANLELFSSSPKDLNIYWSDRFPTRDWTSLGEFVAQDHRTFQTFSLQQQGYGKFMKIEMLSHYGTEHYCPLSVVRVYGTSMVDEYEEMETVHHSSEDEEDRLDMPSYEGKDTPSKDLFGSAKEAVYNMVRKAAQALTRENEGSEKNETSSLLVGSEVNASVCTGTSEAFYGQLVKCGLCNNCNDSLSCNTTYCKFLHSLLNSRSWQAICDCYFCQCTVTGHSPDIVPDKQTASVTSVNVSTDVDSKTHVPSINATSSQEQISISAMDIASSSILVTPLVPPPTHHRLLQPSVEDTTDTSTTTVDLPQETIQPSPSIVPTTSHLPIEDLPKNESWEVEPKQFGNGGASAAQKESVFVRLNNRIRSLETNLSLSSLYLQELSQRYRRQMEDMQRIFNRTVAALNETARKAAEKDARQQETIQELQEKVAALSQVSELMMSERHAIYRQVYEAHLFLIVTQVIVVVTILSLCLRRVKMAAEPVKKSSLALYSSPLKRHHSISSLHSIPSEEKKRRPSGDLSSSNSHGHLMIVEPSVPIFLEPLPPKGKKKNKNKKPRHLHRSLSNPNLATFSSSHANNENISGSVSVDRPVAVRQGISIPMQNLTNGILKQVHLSKDKSGVTTLNKKAV